MKSAEISKMKYKYLMDNIEQKERYNLHNTD